MAMALNYAVRVFGVTFFLVAAATATATVHGHGATPLSIYIDPELTPAFRDGNSSFTTHNIFVTMRNGTSRILGEAEARLRADSSEGVGGGVGAGARRTALYSALRQHAAESQAPLLEALRKLTITTTTSTTSFWITNQLYIRGADDEMLALLASRSDIVSRIEKEVSGLKVVEEKVLEHCDRMPKSRRAEDEGEVELPYNLNLIRVAAVWEAGVNGTGVVVGHIDTGVRATHTTLTGSYKNDGHSWFDAVDGSKAPFDGHGQGTMSMGVLVGGGWTDALPGENIGVAWGAKWIACRAISSQGTGDQSDFLECGQFILCPTGPDGSGADCEQAPHVVSNGWNSVDQGAVWFLDVLAAWRAGGIIPVWSAGNYGDRDPSCQSMGSQAPSPAVLAVGASTEQDGLWPRSSMGPSVLDPEVVKPELVAPGEAILAPANFHDNAYALNQGTGMAAVHVAGVVALLLSADPTLKFDDVKSILEATADQNLLFSGAECEGISDSVFPNYQFGHGRLDAAAAYESIMKTPTTTTTNEPEPTTTTTTTTEQPPPAPTTTEEPEQPEQPGSSTTENGDPGSGANANAFVWNIRLGIGMSIVIMCVMFIS